MRTLQEIYDFCLLDRTYNAYFDIPDYYHCYPEQFRYYHTFDSRGQTRAGSYIYGQSMRQLDRFLGHQPKNYNLHVDMDTYQVSSLRFDRSVLYVITSIGSSGVQIQYEHPFDRHWISFIARSHKPFDRFGIIAEFKNHLSQILLPPGKYRDLQMEYLIPKELFFEWYRNYKQDEKDRAEKAHQLMLEEYTKEKPLSYEECKTLLQASGALYDFASDEFEAEQMIEEFMSVVN